MIFPTTKQCVFCKDGSCHFSREHIIPKCICGCLVSDCLICDKCNNKLGNKIDSLKSDLFTFIIISFGLIEKKVSKLSLPVVRFSDKLKYNLRKDNHFDLAEQCVCSEINEKGTAIKFTGSPNHNFFKSEVGKLVNNIPESNMEDVENSSYVTKEVNRILKEGGGIKDEVEYLSDWFGINIYDDYNDKRYLLFVLKILFLFLKYKKPDLLFNEDKIVKILNNTSDSVSEICYFFYGKKNLFQEKSYIAHNIYIRGDNSSKRIIGYIKLFSVVPFICVLDDKYQGEDFIISYGYDLLEKREIDVICNEIDNIENLKLYRDNLSYQQIYKNNIVDDLVRINKIYNENYPENLFNSFQYAVYVTIKDSLPSEEFNKLNIYDRIRDHLRGQEDIVSRLDKRKFDEYVKKVADLIIIYARNSSNNNSSRINSSS